MDIIKVSETEFEETLPVPKVRKTLDSLLADLENAKQGLKNNQDGVVYHTQFISDLEEKIVEVKALGIKEGKDIVPPPDEPLAEHDEVIDP